MNARSKSTAAQAAPEAEQTAGQPAAPAAGASAAVAVVQPAPQAASAPDEHHGRGGLYVMRDGRRELVERTESPE